MLKTITALIWVPVFVLGCKTTPTRDELSLVSGFSELKRENFCASVNLKTANLLLNDDNANGKDIFNELLEEDKERTRLELKENFIKLDSELKSLNPGTQLNENSYCEWVKKAKSDRSVTILEGQYLCKKAKDLSSCYYSKSDTDGCYYLRKNYPKSFPTWVNDSCEIVYKGVRSTLNGAAGQFCSFLTSAAIDDEPDVACGAKVIKTVCALHYKAPGKIEENLSKVGKNELDGNKISEVLAKSFISASLSCAASLATSELKNAILSDPDSATAGFARFVFNEESVTSLQEEGAKLAAEGGVAYCARCLPRFNLKTAGKAVVRGVALAACSIAADRIANAIDQNADLPRYESCRPQTPSEISSRTAACFRTAKSACRSYAGLVDFNAIVEAKGAAGIAVDSLSVATTLGCGIAGKVSSAACGVISESMNQINQAIKTGNNSWAECAGTTRMGACIGEWLGSNGHTNNKGTSQAYLTKDNKTKRDCCECIKTTYQSEWLKDKPLKSEIYRSVIQSGDFSSGNCPRPGGKKMGKIFWHSEKHIDQSSGNEKWIYHKYSGCKKITVDGNSCHL